MITRFAGSSAFAVAAACAAFPSASFAEDGGEATDIVVTANKRVPEFSDARAQAIEQRIAFLVASGVSEEELRELVRSSIQLGRGL